MAREWEIDRAVAEDGLRPGVARAQRGWHRQRSRLKRAFSDYPGLDKGIGEIPLAKLSIFNL
jgi:hypothetical protein